MRNAADTRPVVLACESAPGRVVVHCCACGRVVLDGSYLEDGETETLAALHFCAERQQAPGGSNLSGSWSVQPHLAPGGTVGPCPSTRLHHRRAQPARAVMTTSSRQQWSSVPDQPA